MYEDHVQASMQSTVMNENDKKGNFFLTNTQMLCTLPNASTLPASESYNRPLVVQQEPLFASS
jgi:hypothetical protein